MTPDPSGPDPATAEPPGGDPATPDPRAEYERRLASRAADVERLEAREGRLANLRLGLFALAALAVWLLRGQAPAWVVLAPAALLFVWLMVAHGRVRRRLRRARNAVTYYERGLDRLEHRFAGTGSAGDAWQDGAHPYAVHLDLFGTGSLYELLCGSRTAAGRETLAGWLLEPAPLDEIRARQEAVRELSGRLDLREDLAALETSVVDALDSGELLAWSTAPGRLPGPVWRALALGLAVAAIATGVAAVWVGLAPLTVVLLAQVGVWLTIRGRVGVVLAALEGPAQALRLAQAALERIERERFSGPRLSELGAVLGAGHPPPSHRLRGLLGRIDALEWRKNQMFLPVAAALMWGTNWAYAIERWRIDHGAEIGTWIQAVGELEALLDLGRYRFERPENRFPELVDEGAVFEARAMVHPLLANCTPNDVSLSADRPLIVVTGSNMSGKSTLLRTLGINVVLAQAGAPVCARSLRMSHLSVGASIHTVDSLQDGASRFYAEIHAIKRAMDAAESHRPGLFLLDELLHGTNSHDRRIGAASIIGGFLDRGALGVVTTHDLALASIADEIGPRAWNGHFEFEIEDGEIRFDYTLRPGVVQTGNALEIMRAAGLEI